jgi:hypothetical protein
MAKRIRIKKTNSLGDTPLQGISVANAAPASFGVWGKVLERHSEDHSVDILTAGGFRFTRVPVASPAWTTLSDPVLGERNLPPKDALAFIFMPDGSVDSAFIPPFSCFMPAFEKHIEVFLSKGKEEEDRAAYEGNWSKKFDKATGDMEIVGTDGGGKTLTITIKKSEKNIRITDWNGNDIVIGKSGMKIEDKDGNMITMDSGGIKQESANLLELKGKQIKADGGAVANGRGGWCAIATCPYAGIPHVGDTLAGG